jgi:hypothetical protein
VQASGHAGQCTADGEGGQPGAGQGHAAGLGGPFVVPHRQQGPARTAAPQVHHHGYRRREHRDAEQKEVPLVVEVEPAEEDRPPDFGRDPRLHVGRIEEEARHRHGQGQGGHRQEQAPDPQGGQTEGHGGDQPGGAGAEEGQEQVGVRLEEIASGHRADADDGELAEADLARPAGQHDQRQGDEGVHRRHRPEQAELLDRHRHPEQHDGPEGRDVEQPPGPHDLREPP